MVTRSPRWIALASVAASLVLIGALTLSPSSGANVTPTFCIICGELGGVDFVLNVVLFAPFGMAMQWFTGRWKMTIIAGFVATLIVETLQWRLVGGRDASLGDILANTMGSGVGGWTVLALPLWIHANRSAARHYAALSAAITCAIFIASAWLLLPVRPDGFQWVQYTPIRRNTEPFRGRLEHVTLNDRAIRPVETLRPEQTFDQSSSQSLRVVVGGHVEPSSRRAIMIRAANDGEESFFLAQRGAAVLYRSYIVACELKLRPILVRHQTAFAVVPEMRAAESSIVIEAWSRPSELGVRVPETGDAVTLPRTVGLAWALFLPTDVALDNAFQLANAVWLAVLVFPATFFVARSGVRVPNERLSRLQTWPLVMVIGVLAASPGAGLHHLSVSEWAGVLAGLGLGALVERLTRQPLAV